ncbi:hypothetical protein BCR34DRAFT_614623 [Clohesyomyces aquaticus]|uniref:Uncharacterized protein n=1 Tax=Clohesyomyces aquaticus TaxID=1231657 RepID=A0A1Y1ZN47_9PLEO|nr:hypothetical protein BCR34DRAFT_614623 [Clohesyomyces aquaticus]
MSDTHYSNYKYPPRHPPNWGGTSVLSYAPGPLLEAGTFEIPRSLKEVTDSVHDNVPSSLPKETATRDEVRYFLFDLLTVKEYKIAKNWPQWVIETVAHWDRDGYSFLAMEDNFESLCPLNPRHIDGLNYKERKSIITHPPPQCRATIGRVISNFVKRERARAIDKDRIAQEWQKIQQGNIERRNSMRSVYGDQNIVTMRPYTPSHSAMTMYRGFGDLPRAYAYGQNVAQPGVQQIGEERSISTEEYDRRSYSTAPSSIYPPPGGAAVHRSSTPQSVRPPSSAYLMQQHAHLAPSRIPSSAQSARNSQYQLPTNAPAHTYARQQPYPANAHLEHTTPTAYPQPAFPHPPAYTQQQNYANRSSVGSVCASELTERQPTYNQNYAASVHNHSYYPSRQSTPQIVHRPTDYQQPSNQMPHRQSYSDLRGAANDRVPGNVRGLQQRSSRSSMLAEPIIEMPANNPVAERTSSFSLRRAAAEQMAHNNGKVAGLAVELENSHISEKPVLTYAPSIASSKGSSRYRNNAQAPPPRPSSRGTSIYAPDYTAPSAPRTFSMRSRKSVSMLDRLVQESFPDFPSIRKTPYSAPSVAPSMAVSDDRAKIRKVSSAHSIRSVKSKRSMHFNSLEAVPEDARSVNTQYKSVSFALEGEPPMVSAFQSSTRSSANWLRDQRALAKAEFVTLKGTDATEYDVVFERKVKAMASLVSPFAGDNKDERFGPSTRVDRGDGEPAPTLVESIHKMEVLRGKKPCGVPSGVLNSNPTCNDASFWRGRGA